MEDLISLISNFGPDFVQAALVTWKLTLVSFFAGLALALILTMLRILPIKPLKWFLDLYVELFRNIPGMALLIIIVFALPYLNLVIDYEPSVILTLVLVASAFAMDNIRSGINTVEPGQVEAAYSLGMGTVKTMIYIVLPQALRRVVQPMTSLLIGIMLSTAIASQVPLEYDELTGLVDKINNDTASGILTFAISAGIYLLSGLFLSYLGARLDAKLRILR